MTTEDPLDPLIHAPARLRIVVTLAALGEGDAMSFTRLQHMLDLTPGNLITHIRKLEDAGYLTSDKTGNGTASRTSIALTQHGRAALGTYTTALRGLLDGVQPDRSASAHPTNGTSSPRRDHPSVIRSHGC